MEKKFQSVINSSSYLSISGFFFSPNVGENVGI